MIVQIIESLDKYPSVGDVFTAKNYTYDNEKYTLLEQLDPITRRVINDDIGLNEYKSNCKVIS